MITNKINNYYIIKKIASGGFSTLYLSYDLTNFYALKIIEYENGLKEINHMKNLNQQSRENNCLYYIDYFKYKNDLIIIYPYLFMSLDNILQTYFKNGLPEELVLKIYNDMKKSLNYIHSKNIIHADIKPDNICVKLNDKIDYSILNNENLNIIQQLNKIKNKKQKINEINKLYNLIKKENDNEEYYSDEDDDIMTDSDIDSEDEIELIYEYSENNKQEINNSIEINKKIIDFFMNSTFYLCDFGNSFILDDKLYYLDYNTRYYRAPEIILRCNHTIKSDYWALGCTLCELLHNKILFEPIKLENETTDIMHLSLLLFLGNFDKLKNGRKYNYFFDENDRLKTNYIIKDFKNKFMLKCNNNNLQQIINSLLKINYNERILI